MFLGFVGFGLQAWEKFIFNMWVLRIKTKEVKQQMGHTVRFRELQFMGPADLLVLPKWVQLSICFAFPLPKISKSLPLLETQSVYSLFVFLANHPTSSHTQNPEIFQFLQHHHSISSDL